MPGIDSYTKLMLHMNGTNGSTIFTDDSASAHSPVAVGNAQISTTLPVFGNGCGSLIGTGDYISVLNSSDWDFGSNPMAFDFRYKFNVLTGNHIWVGRPTSGSSYFYFGWEGGGIRCRDFTGSNVFDANWGVIWSPVIDTWYHIAITRDSSGHWRFFVDGVQKGITITNQTASFTTRTVAFEVGECSSIGYITSGTMDEFRVSNGDSRWTANFTPPTQEYTSADITVNANVLTITSSIKEPTIKIDTVVTPNVLSIQSTLKTPTVGQVVTVTPNVLTINSSIKSPTTKIDTIVEPPVLTIQSTLKEPIFPVQGSLVAKIISVNPLIAVTDTSPVQIIKIDITDPNNLDYTSVTIPNINNAKDVTVDFSGDYVYVAGNSGKVVKVEIADLTNQTTYDLSDTDDILTIEHNVDFGITYAGTDNDTGELYTLDERSTFKLDSDFTCLAPYTFKLDSNFNIVSAFKMDSAFTALSYNYFKMGSDFKCLTKELTPITSVDDITPINLEDFQVFVNSVELEDTDLVLNSISITHSIGEESRASFQLSRKHDKLNTTLEGVSSEITNQNIVEIKIKGVTEFSGKISKLDCQYQDNTEFVNVSAFSTEKENKFNKITMSLPGLNSRLSLYDILLQNPSIYNPYVDPDNEDNPKKYKGIRVDLGTEIEQHITNWRFSDTGVYSPAIWKSIPGIYASAITNGTFVPWQNWTYFWGATVYKIGKTELGDTVGHDFLYIGTSLAPVSEDLWQLINAHHFRQRIYDDTKDGRITIDAYPGYTETERVEVETEQIITNPKTWGNSSSWRKKYEYKTYYYIGEAPFKEISARNGKKITKPKFEDTPSLLVSTKDAGYDFTKYAKTVADLEYEILKNINGNILPDSSCSFNLTVDAYLYYAISLLTRINIDNTTKSNIYNNANGFPLSVKSITITSSDRRVNINADNTKSSKELEIINASFPDEDDDEYNELARKVSIFGKFDMRTRLEVE